MNLDAIATRVKEGFVVRGRLRGYLLDVIGEEGDET